MHIHMDLAGSLPGFERGLETVTRDGDIQGVLVLSCAANDFPFFEMNLVLRTRPFTIFGGIFPSIVYGTRRFERGTIFVGLSRALKVVVIPSLSDEEMNLRKVLGSAALDSEGMKTMMLFVDRSSPNIGSLVDELTSTFGVGMNCLGGATGSPAMPQNPCLFSNDGLLDDAAILVLLDLESGIGVSHGWESIRGPYRVTESEGNVIRTLDWKPAFEVYRDVVETHSGRRFAEEGFWGVTRSYPLGVTKTAIEKVVRDPLDSGPDGSLSCMGDVPEGVFVDILHGRADDLITAAGRASTLANLAFQGSAKHRMILLMDCISRVQYLGNRFREEIQAIHHDRLPMLGACPIGQVGGGGKDPIEFHTKTAVVGVLERP